MPDNFLGSFASATCFSASSFALPVDIGGGSAVALILSVFCESVGREGSRDGWTGEARNSG